MRILKGQLRGFVSGIIIMTLVFGGMTAFAVNKTVQGNLTFRDIKIYIDGALFTPKDGNGNVVEPFIYNGSTYLPLKAVATAFGNDVVWDGNTSSVYIGGKDAADTIRIGLNYEVSGPLATYGQSVVEGIRLAIDETNAAGGINGKKIEAVQYDNMSEEAEVIPIAERLMTQDKVVAVLGPVTSGRFKAQMPIAEKNQIPVLSGTATADDLTVDVQGVKEFAFRSCISDSLQGMIMANFAEQNLGAKSAVILADDSSDYGRGLAKTFREAFIAHGGKIVAEEKYTTQEKDFSSMLSKIKGKQFDVIFIPGYYEEAGRIIKQARDLGIAAPILGADGFDSPILLELAGASALDQVYFSNHYSSLDKDPLVVKFIGDFKAKYGNDPNQFHALGYDMGKYMADAIKRGGEKPTAIQNALASTVDFEGVTGTFSVDKNHDAIKSMVVIELKNGAQVSAVKVKP